MIYIWYIYQYFRPQNIQISKIIYIIVGSKVVQISLEIGSIATTASEPPIQFYGFLSVCCAVFFIRKIRCQTFIFAATRRKRLRSGEVTPLEVAIMRAFYHGNFSEGHQMGSQNCYFLLQRPTSRCRMTFPSSESVVHMSFILCQNMKCLTHL